MSYETPPLLLLNGVVTPWSEANVHIWSETAVRGSNVFEGVRAFWDEANNGWRLLLWQRHLERLFRSAKLSRLAHSFTYEDFHSGASDLLNALEYHESLYIRPTIYADKGRYGLPDEDLVSGFYIVAFPVEGANLPPPTIRCVVSSWRRSSDLDLSPRVKSGASYQQFRLPKIEAFERGVDDAILLNARSTVSELTGAAIVIIRNDTLISPPTSASTLESLTRELVIGIASRIGLGFIEREIDRTELYVADEVLACGTLQEISAITEIDHVLINDGEVGSITARLAEGYRDIVLGSSNSYQESITKIYRH